jgi:hypothetical protein
MSIDYKCKNCTKTYTTYKSLWRHNSLKHGKNVVEDVVISQNNVVKNVVENTTTKIKKNKCKKCNKELSDRISRWKHEKICNKNLDIIDEKKNNKIEKIEEENLEIKLKNEKIEKEMLEYKKEMEKLKEMLQKALKIHPKTLNKINSQLNNNGVINNINIVQLGCENLNDILTDKEKRGILNRQVMGINDLVELVHISGKYKKFMNVYITNLQNTIAYKFDEKMNNFIAVNKSELLNDLVDARMYDIEKFFEEIGPTLDSKKSEQIKKFIERMNNEEDELKGIKKDEIKLVLYNNLEKIKMNEPNIIKLDDKEIDV